MRVAIGGPVETPGIDDDAAERIAMLADPLRGRMHGDVGPQFDRPEQVGRGYRVVDDERDAMPMRDAGERGDIGGLGGRVRDGLGEDCARVRPDQQLHQGKVVDVIHKIGLDAEFGEQAVHRIDGGAVQIPCGDDAASAFRRAQQRRGDRRHAGGEGHGGTAALQCGDATFEHVECRIGHTGV